MCPSSDAARALQNIPKLARVRTSERMERSDMFRERNEKAEHRSEAKERNGLALVIRSCPRPGYAEPKASRE